MMEEPLVRIGILSAPAVSICFNGPYVSNDATYSGNFTARIENGEIVCGERRGYSLSFRPLRPDATFTIADVVIGIKFHWQRLQDQTFQGALRLEIDGGNVLIINEIGAEDYLCSVIGSEMNSTASAELLKAHAVISRSWLLCRLLRDNPLEPFAVVPESDAAAEDTCLRWYGRDEHTRYDVCADDHCQRYQGISRVVEEAVAAAINATRGMVLTYEGRPVDARFSKCCGGMTEAYGAVWENRDVPYLEATPDSAAPIAVPDLTTEAGMREWVEASPDCFCHTEDKALLAQVLNDYDCETSAFFRWTEQISQTQLQQLLRRKAHVDVGQIRALKPVKRGRSGRIERLRIEGTAGSITVGKELEIRAWLSESHLRSAAFCVEAGPTAAGVPAYFTLHGAGWGHGVGLCQIGAAAMSAQGYDFREILAHYYHHTSLTQIYN